MPDSIRVFVAELAAPARATLRAQAGAAGWIVVDRLEEADVVLTSAAAWPGGAVATTASARRSQPHEPLIEALTTRERDVLTLLADGLSNREIAGRLGISEHTVKFHLGAVFGKLGASTRTDAVTKGLRLGLVEI